MGGKRKYELKKRAAQVGETRQRITEATVELHRTVGPAATQISEIARRAGVQRVTVYAHFPDESALFAACSAHWRALHPAPDPGAWLACPDPGERLRLGLRELYAWYRETEPMTANILRDVQLVPAIRPFVEDGFGGYLESCASSWGSLSGRGSAVAGAPASTRACEPRSTSTSGVCCRPSETPKPPSWVPGSSSWRRASPARRGAIGQTASPVYPI